MRASGLSLEPLEEAFLIHYHDGAWREQNRRAIEQQSRLLSKVTGGGIGMHTYCVQRQQIQTHRVTSVAATNGNEVEPDRARQGKARDQQGATRTGQDGRRKDRA